MIRVVKAGLKYLTQKEYRFQYNAGKGHYDSMPDEEYLSKLYEAKFGKKLDLKDNIQSVYKVGYRLVE